MSEQKTFAENQAGRKGGKHKRAGQGSHGSLTKAGWARHNCPVNWENRMARKTKHNLPKKNLKRSKSPRVANRRRYEKRYVLERRSGQNPAPIFK